MDIINYAKEQIQGVTFSTDIIVGFPGETEEDFQETLELVKEVGRLDAPGRPMLFGTTEEFLRTFGVGSIDELPVISEDMVEQYKEEAEYEIASELKEEAMNEEQLTLDI